MISSLDFFLLDFNVWTAIFLVRAIIPKETCEKKNNVAVQISFVACP